MVAGFILHVVGWNCIRIVSLGIPHHRLLADINISSDVMTEDNL